MQTPKRLKDGEPGAQDRGLSERRELSLTDRRFLKATKRNEVAKQRAGGNEEEGGRQDRAPGASTTERGRGWGRSGPGGGGSRETLVPASSKRSPESE